MKVVASFILVLITFSAFAQSKVKKDTFTIDKIPFCVEGENDWMNTMHYDGIQADSNWNFQMRYTPKDNPRNIYAVIGIQIIKNTYYTPTPKEERKFKKQCQVTDTEIGGRKAFFLDYKPVKIKKCKGCAPGYTKLYNIPISRDKTMNIVFFGQAAYSDIIPLVQTFQTFADRFVNQHGIQLTSLGIMNFYAPMSYDTFHVENFYLCTVTPYGYSKVRCQSKLSLASSWDYCIKNFNEEFSIRVQAKYLSPTDTLLLGFNEKDTTVHMAVPGLSTSRQTYGPHSFDIGHAGDHGLKTKRLISMPDGSAILLEFTCDYGWEDVQTTTIALTKYADIVKAENLSPSRRVSMPVKLPPLKIEFDQPGGAKPNQNKPGTLPRPK